MVTARCVYMRAGQLRRGDVRGRHVRPFVVLDDGSLEMPPCPAVASHASCFGSFQQAMGSAGACAAVLSSLRDVSAEQECSRCSLSWLETLRAWAGDAEVPPCFPEREMWSSMEVVVRAPCPHQEGTRVEGWIVKHWESPHARHGPIDVTHTVQ